MEKRGFTQECLSETGFSYTLSLINGKYKMTILYTLMEFGVVRFNEMKKYIGGISPDSAKGGIQPGGLMPRRRFGGSKLTNAGKTVANFQYRQLEHPLGARTGCNYGQGLAVMHPGLCRQA